MKNVTIYTSRLCGYCFAAKRLLDKKSIEYREISVDGQPEVRQEMTQRSGARTVPQIFIDAQPIGGCDDLYALEASGQLDELLGLTTDNKGNSE